MLKMNSTNMSQGASDRTVDRTFQNDESLPSLPLPTLRKTLSRYLDSVKPFVSPEEFVAYKEQVKIFEEGIGKTLHNKLAEKAKHSKNWVSEWWDKKAYLEVRSPTAILGNMIGPAPCLQGIWPPEIGTQLSRAAVYLYHGLLYWNMIRRETITPDVSHAKGNMKQSMHQLRSIFNCGRIPGIKCDKIIRSFKTESEGICHSHMIVTCNGHIYKMYPLDKHYNILSSHEIFRQLTYIKEKSLERGQGIGSLSAGDRTPYAKSYQHLVELDHANKEHLQDIISSILVLALDNGTPLNMSQTFEAALCGPQPWNRWFDKAFSLIVFENGVISCNCDHAAYDGMVMILMNSYVHQQIVKTAGDWQGDAAVDPNTLMPVELVFITDNIIAKAIVEAENTYFINAKKLELLCSRFILYGKKWLKQMKLHPDTCCQLAIQLAYYLMYSKPTPCYETATTRQYYNGRTETVRSTTPEVVEWCKAMVDPNISIGERQTLFQVAYNKHNTLMNEALDGQGCDRHLFGLSCIAEEMGLPTPDIFLHEAYTKSGGGGNFVLSTSLVGYTTMLGGVAAMTYDGYGVFYRIANDHFQFLVTTYTACEETSCSQFFSALHKAFVQIKGLLVPAVSKL